MTEVGTRLLAMMWAATAAISVGLWATDDGILWPAWATFAGLMALIVAIRD